MVIRAEKEIQLRAKRSHELFMESIKLFEDYLKPSVPATGPDYYRARNLFKEGRAYLDQTLQQARKLLGPVPIYAARDFAEQRDRVLSENRIIIRAENLADVIQELIADELVASMMTREDVESYITARYEAQKEGHRKLPNIKMRMIIDWLEGLAVRCQVLQKEAQMKQQGVPI